MRSNERSRMESRTKVEDYNRQCQTLKNEAGSKREGGSRGYSLTILRAEEVREKLLKKKRKKSWKPHVEKCPKIEALIDGNGILVADKEGLEDTRRFPEARIQI